MSNETLDLKILKLAYDIEAVSDRRKALQSKAELLLAEIRRDIAASQARISETQR